MLASLEASVSCATQALVRLPQERLVAATTVVIKGQPSVFTVACACA